MLEARADDRYAAALAAYQETLAARAEKERLTGKKPRGKPPTPPSPGPTPKDQYNFTDPDSRIMKNSTNTGFDQHYNCQATVEHASRLIVGCAVSHHPTDTREAGPAFDTIPAALGAPDAACLDHGYWSPDTVADLTARGITPYIAVGNIVHGLNWARYYATAPSTPPPPDASPSVQMAYQLTTAAGREQYRHRKSTVEPVIGIIKAILGFRQFSLRGLANVQGEWRLVCLAYNCKRFLTLQTRKAAEQAQAVTMRAAQTVCRLLSGGLPARTQRSGIGDWLARGARSVLQLTQATARRLPTGC